MLKILMLITTILIEINARTLPSYRRLFHDHDNINTESSNGDTQLDASIDNYLVPLLHGKDLINELEIDKHDNDLFVRQKRDVDDVQTPNNDIALDGVPLELLTPTEINKPTETDLHEEVKNPEPVPETNTPEVEQNEPEVHESVPETNKPEVEQNEPEVHESVPETNKPEVQQTEPEVHESTQESNVPETNIPDHNEEIETQIENPEEAENSDELEKPSNNEHNEEKHFGGWYGGGGGGYYPFRYPPYNPYYYPKPYYPVYYPYHRPPFYG